ncbi:MAG: hypothetical protein NT139_00270 [Candidatus Woesearchaeota archaeon]|nr:hypothetical protein [Candidatus Woesearchaeota archaeon]
MRVRSIIISIALGLFLLAFLYSNYTGFVTYNIGNPSYLKLNLTKTDYATNESLSGNILLTIKNPISSETKVKLTLDEESQEIKLTDLLDQLNITYATSEGSSNVVNPSDIKLITFPTQGVQEIDFLIPSGSEIENISMTIEGLPQNSKYPTFPYIDINEDGLIEWQYFGNFVNWATNYIYPQSLNLQSGESTIIIDNNQLYCQVIDIPYTKDIGISAKYNKYEQIVDMKASILSFPQDLLNQDTITTNGINTCDLPEPSSLNWYSCTINFDTPISGPYLICVYNTKTPENVNYYKFITDKSPSQTAYICPSVDADGIAECNLLDFGNFMIRLNIGNYSNQLKTVMPLARGFTQYDFIESLNKYLSECSTVDGINCIVPLKIHSSSAGKLALSNLLIKYNDNGVKKEENTFYDVTPAESAIYKIDYSYLTNTTINITIPLSTFDLKTPYISKDYKTYDLDIYVTPNLQKSEEITVYASQGKTESAISSSKEKLNRLLTNQSAIVTSLGYDTEITPILTTLTNYQTQLDNLKTSNKTIEQKQNETEYLYKKVNSLIEDLPERIYTKGSLTDTLLIEPKDVTQDIISPDQTPEEIYYYQKIAKITSTSTSFEIEKFSGKKEEVTLVKKSITGNLRDGYIVEIIPKNIAQSASQIKFLIQPEILENDPVVRWSTSSIMDNEIEYVVSGDVTYNSDALKTIIVPNELPKDTKFEARCGDGKCTSIRLDGQIIPLEDKITCPEDCSKIKIKWIYIIIACIIVGLGVYYINFYKGKFSFRNLINKTEELFYSKADEEKLINYIKRSLEQKIPKSKINKALLEKGWTLKQINHAYKKLESKK